MRCTAALLLCNLFAHFCGGCLAVSVTTQLQHALAGDSTKAGVALDINTTVLLDIQALQAEGVNTSALQNLTPAAATIPTAGSDAKLRPISGRIASKETSRAFSMLMDHASEARRQTQKFLEYSQELAQAGRLDALAVLSALLLDLLIVGACFWYVSNHWDEWIGANEGEQRNRIGLGEAGEALIKALEQNRETVEAVCDLLVKFPLLSLFPAMGLLALMELVVSSGLDPGCHGRLLGWMQFDSLIALGGTGVFCPSVKLAKEFLADPLRVAASTRTWYQSGQRWPALLETLLPDRDIESYKVPFTCFLAGTIFIIASLVSGCVGAYLVVVELLNLCGLPTLLTALVLVVFRLLVSFQLAVPLWWHRYVLFYGEADDSWPQEKEKKLSQH
mmetsp:Transcript_2214/g.4663  ORF Transcript_2214/g.4663 Transcript_2214/m.4663 type:complete len:390 (+) Transcript_2214:38-1207(+)